MTSKLKVLVSALVVCLAAGTLSACGGGDEADDSASDGGGSTTPTDGSQSMAQLAGYGRSCVILSSAGSGLNGKAYDRYLSLNANGTYSFSTNITNATACQNGSSSGTGYNVIASQLNVSGTYAIGGTNTSPSTATKITFTPTSQTFTIYSPQSNSVALAVANWANHCTGWSDSFSTTATQSKTTFTPNYCGVSNNVDLGAPPGTGGAQYNIIYRNNSGDFQTGATVDLWSPSAGSFVGSYGLTWE